MIEVNGMAHVILTVSQWDKARAFYGELARGAVGEKKRGR